MLFCGEHGTLDYCPLCAENEKWMPIETAPKDQNILLYGAKRLDYCVGRFQGGEWITESSHEWHLMYTPTHWMPLPKPPKS